jgi:hypothetical protein
VVFGPGAQWHDAVDALHVAEVHVLEHFRDVRDDVEFEAEFLANALEFVLVVGG